jgi:hypothetical protein
MQSIRRVAVGDIHQSGAAFRTRLRLFGLLALLVPLFAGLQYLVREAVPRVEIRLVSQDVSATVPVLVPVEVLVERIVYVQVDRSGTVPQLNAPAGLPEAVFQPAAPVDLPPAPTIEGRDQLEANVTVPVANAETANAEAVAEAPDREIAPIAAPASEIIATGTYRPRPPVTAARAVAPVPVPLEIAEADEPIVEEEAVAPEAVTDEPVVEAVAEAPRVRTVTVANVVSSADGDVAVTWTTEVIPEPANNEPVASDEGISVDESAELSEDEIAGEPSVQSGEQPLADLAVTAEGVMVEEHTGQ